MRRLLLWLILPGVCLSLAQAAQASFYYTTGAWRYNAQTGTYIYVPRFPLESGSGLVYTGQYSYAPLTSYRATGGYYYTGAYGGFMPYYPSSAYNSGIPGLYSPVPRNLPTGKVSVGPLWFPGYGVAAY